MSTITIPRSDVTSEEVADALRQGLGSRYHVLPGTGINATPVASPGTDQPDTILVGTGTNRVFRAEVAISRHSGETLIQVRPGGLPGTWPGGLRLTNRLGIARKTRQVLQAAPGFR
jgi:sugar (pentulose or hexulose) kinase